MKVILKEREFEAHQWFKNGDHPQDYSEVHADFEGGIMREFTAAECKAKGWEGDVVRYFRHPEIPGNTICSICGKYMHEHGFIDLGPGGYTVCPGDWILTGATNGLYVPFSRTQLNELFDVVGGDAKTPAAINFGDAIEALKDGKRATRRGWNGKGLKIALQKVRVRSGGDMDRPYIYIEYPPGYNYPLGSRVPWAPSQTDMLSTDWEIFDK